jgi:hypothetical protein
VGAAPRATLAAAPTDPCSLLTTAEVSAALGVTVPAPKPPGKICRWAPADSKPGGPAVVLTLQDAQAFEFAKAPASSANVTKTPVSGIGDDAVFNTIGVVTAMLMVKKGETYFEVHVYGFPVEETKARETTLAREVVARLK